MFRSFDEAQTFVRDNSVEMVDLKFCDLWGRWHHVTIPASRFTPTLMEKGVGFDGSSVGFKAVSAGDMVMVPDLETGFVDPFWEVPTLSFICATLEADTRQLFPYDPRNIARRAEEHLRAVRDRGLEPVGAGVRVLPVRRCLVRERHERRVLPCRVGRGRLGQLASWAAATTSRATAATTRFRPRIGSTTPAPASAWPFRRWASR